MSITDQAKSEMDRTNFGADDKRVIVEILEKFFDQWDSGGAVSCMAPVLTRLIAGKPLSPLTGADDEWLVHDFDDDVYAQNVRCGTVFKRKDGSAYDIADGPRKPITFPYLPERAEIDSPVVTIG